MSFNSAIPLITDPLLQSANQIKANFQAINAAFGDNHVSLAADASTLGKHNLLSFRPQIADPATSSTQTALYNKLVSAIPELFFRHNNSQTPIQLTYPSIKADNTLTQYSFIAGPFIVYGGFIKAPTNGQVVTLSPGTQLIFVDLIVASSTTVNHIDEAAATAIAGTSFTIKYAPFATGSLDIYYLAIGL
jgi:hypothetical protein